MSSKKDLKIPAIAVVDNIVFSDKEAWAYYIISEKPYDFLSNDAKLNLASNTMIALSSLCQTATKKVDCHLLISNFPFDVDSWENQVRQAHSVYEKVNTLPFQQYVDYIGEELRHKKYQKRVALLGIKLATRNGFDFDSMNFLEYGFKDMWETFKKGVDAFFNFNISEISLEEEHKTKTLEEETYRLLSTGTLKVKRPSSEDILLHLKKRFYPAMPSPYLEVNHEARVGVQDIVMETTGEIENKPRWLKFTQAIEGKDFVGYRATLSLSKFPDDMRFPTEVAPFLYRKEMLPYTVNARFVLTPTEEMKKLMFRKRQDADDEIENLAESGQRPSAGLKETVRDLSTMEQLLEGDSHPWVSGSYRITIEAQSENELRERIAELKQEYAKNDTVLTWTSGDQLTLFKEELLGGKLYVNSFNHTTDISLLGISGMNFGSFAGDPIVQSKRRIRK